MGLPAAAQQAQSRPASTPRTSHRWCPRVRSARWLPRRERRRRPEPPIRRRPRRRRGPWSRHAAGRRRAPPSPRPGRARRAGRAAGAGPDRLDFQLKFPTERGGGAAAGSAANLEYKREDYAVLSGEVQLKYQDLDLKADELEIDLQTKTVIAMGHVILDQGPRRLAGDSLTFNLDSKTGTIRHATGQVAPDYHFTGDQVDKTGADTYVIKDGVFTSCTQPVPDWSFRVREATVQVDGYARVHGAKMRAKKLPVLYTPYLLWPVKSDRSSGFLIPNIGYSERRGGELGFAYFQTLGRSYDTTFHLDTYTSGYLGLGNEFRYAPTAGTKGDFIGYSIYDPESREWRWKLELNHTTNDLPRGMRGRRPVPGLFGLQLVPGLRARLRPQHPAVHREPRLRDRQLGAAPRQPAAQQPRDLGQPTDRRHADPAPAPRAPVPPALDPDRQDAVLPRGRQHGVVPRRRQAQRLPGAVRPLRPLPAGHPAGEDVPLAQPGADRRRAAHLVRRHPEPRPRRRSPATP